MFIYHPQYRTSYHDSSRPMMVGSGSWFYFGGSQSWPLEAAAGYYTRVPGPDDRDATLHGFDGPFLVDIEHLKFDAENHAKSVEHLQAAVSQYRQRWGGRIGIYDIMPRRAWWEAITPSRRAEWSSSNLKLRSGYAALAHSVDFVSPCLYLPYAGSSKKDVEVFLRHNLHQASLFDKPIIPALWPSIDKVPREYMGDDLWRFVLETVRDSATKPEGVMLWDEASWPYPPPAIAILRDVFS